jgi:D-alanyl-lipoteichoic acid acyltransferase DltB (MBOAT superfamily)
MQPTGFVITFACVAASMIIFRSANLKTAADLFKGMLGLHGIGLSQLTGSDVVVVSAFIALVCPNTPQILSQHEPALG